MKKSSQSKINRNRGKRHEASVAERLGGKRIGVLIGEDVFHLVYSIECKSRKKIVTEGWFEQCETNNKDGKIPLLITHIKGKSYDKDLVCMRMTDWEQLNKKIEDLDIFRRLTPHL